MTIGNATKIENTKENCIDLWCQFYEDGTVNYPSLKGNGLVKAHN